MGSHNHWETVNVFEDWASKVVLLEKWTSEYGGLRLMCEDLHDILKNEDLDPKEVYFYSKQVFLKFYFLYEESWALIHGQLQLSWFQLVIHRKYIVEGIHLFKKKDNEQSSRFATRKQLPMSACSYHGLMFLSQSKLKVHLF
jgi:hypothetical protein